MKTVSGTVTSSKPVSLSRAARSLAKFIYSDNGASPAFTAYLKRTSASCDELVQLHKELKGSGYESKAKKRYIDETVNSVKKPSENGLISKEKHGARDRTKQSSEGNARDRTKQSSEANVSRNVDSDANNEIERQGGGKEAKKKKKKHKSDTQENDGAVKIEKPEQSANGEANNALDNDSSERKRHNKSKKEKHYKKESSDVTNPNDDSNDRKKSKKRKHKGSDH